MIYSNLKGADFPREISYLRPRGAFYQWKSSFLEQFTNFSVGNECFLTKNAKISEKRRL